MRPLAGVYTAALAALSTAVAHRERRLTFAGLFSFGEQGPLVSEHESCHAHLMMGLLVALIVVLP